MDTQKTHNTGTGLAMGAAFGLIVGMLFMEGNIALGLASGAAFGLIIGSMTDQLGRLPVATLTGIAEGALIGSILGTAAGILHGGYSVHLWQGHVNLLLGQPFDQGYVGVGLMIGAAIGMVIGAIQEVRRPHHSLSAAD